VPFEAQRAMVGTTVHALGAMLQAMLGMFTGGLCGGDAAAGGEQAQGGQGGDQGALHAWFLADLLRGQAFEEPERMRRRSG
jgi:hypothetical protein